MNRLQLLLLLATTASAHAARRPNVLFIVSDDLRPEMGCYGGAAISPSIDALASSPGTVLFTRAYVQQAICCPSRSSFLLGRRPDTTRVWDLKTQFRESGGKNWTTLPEYFRQRGYYTAGMGKVFHPVKWKGKKDDIAGGSWSAPYFHGQAGSEDSAHRLNETNCGLADADEDDEHYSDGKVRIHAVETLRSISAARRRRRRERQGRRGTGHDHGRREQQDGQGRTTVDLFDVEEGVDEGLADAASSRRLPEQEKGEEDGAPFFLAVGFHRPHLPWVVPKQYFDLYNNTTIALADHNTPPTDYNVTGAQTYSWDPQSGPRHCAPLYSQTHPVATLPEFGLVDDDSARHFRKSYYAAVSQMDTQVGGERVTRRRESSSTHLLPFFCECVCVRGATGVIQTYGHAYNRVVIHAWVCCTCYAYLGIPRL